MNSKQNRYPGNCTVQTSLDITPTAIAFKVNLKADSDIMFPCSAGLLEEGQSVLFASAEQFFTMVCCMIPASVEEIGESCFSGCSSLSRVTFASGSAVRRIGKEAFRECRKLSEIEIPASVEEIGERCVWGCSSLSRGTFASGSALSASGRTRSAGARNL